MQQEIKTAKTQFLSEWVYKSRVLNLFLIEMTFKMMITVMPPRESATQYAGQSCP